MPPSVFAKVKLRLNRAKGNVSSPDTGDLPPLCEKSEVTTSAPVSKPTAASPEVQRSDPVPKSAIATSPKVLRSQSKPLIEVAIEPCYIAEPVEFVNEKSIPQWRWPNSHVQAWLMAVLMRDMKISPDKAMEIVGLDVGIGANLYCRTKVYWMRVLDVDLGEKMYVKLLGMRGKEGAVPDFCHVRQRK
ncbi:hypothetical protein ACEPPN_000143 [Leptodophora sp. 'Broadleaf-Isolate-01']